MPVATTPARADISKALLAAIESTLRDAYERGHIMGDHGTRLPTFPSGLSKDPGLALSRLIRDERATTTLETGMALGLSTLWMLHGLLGVAHDSPGSTPRHPHHTAVDPFQTRHWSSAGLRLVEAAGASDLVTLVEADSTIALPLLIAERAADSPFKRPIDLLFVDGGHSFELAFSDIFFGARLVRPGGLIVVDDVWMPAVTTVVNYFLSNNLLTREARPDIEATKRFALLRVPEVPTKRAWDHFVPFDVALPKPQ